MPDCQPKCVGRRSVGHGVIYMHQTARVKTIIGQIWDVELCFCYVSIFGGIARSMGKSTTHDGNMFQPRGTMKVTAANIFEKRPRVKRQ